MTENKNSLRDLSENAISSFFSHEADNIALGTREENLCGRLALIINDLLPEFGFQEYYVDTEYNRKQNGEIKTILDDDYEIIRIRCDLIVHSRGDKVKNDNLLAIEMKKSNLPEEEKESDRKRLRALTKTSYDDTWSNDGLTHPEHVCGYHLGKFIEIDVENRTFNIDTFIEGEFINKSEGQF